MLLNTVDDISVWSEPDIKVSVPECHSVLVTTTEIGENRLVKKSIGTSMKLHYFIV